MIGFRQVDSRYPFFWESSDQPSGRWHGEGTGPVQYVADTPDGAWAEFLRHEEITDGADLDGIARSLWAIEVPEQVRDAEVVDIHTAIGGPESYPACQAYAAGRRAAGVTMLDAPSAALEPGSARGQLTDSGLRDASDRDGRVWVLYGVYPDVRGWRVVERGRPPHRVLQLTRPL